MDLAAGDHAFTARATDVAGLTGTSTAQNVTTTVSIVADGADVELLDFKAYPYREQIPDSDHHGTLKCVIGMADPNINPPDDAAWKIGLGQNDLTILVAFSPDEWKTMPGTLKIELEGDPQEQGLASDYRMVIDDVEINSFPYTDVKSTIFFPTYQDLEDRLNIRRIKNDSSKPLRLKFSVDAGGVRKTSTLIISPVVVKYVDRDDPTHTWTTSVEPELLPANQAVYSGKETGDLVSWSLSSDLFAGGNFTWTAERKTPSSPSVTITGPTGVNKNEWKLNSPINWLPGTYKIKCTINKGDSSSLIEFNQRVGVRTDDIVVVGWIDPDPIVLNTAGVQAGLLSVLPTGGLSPSSGDNAKIKAALLVKHISEVGVGSSFEIDLGLLMDGTVFTAFSAADKTYALRWMFKYGSNSTPDTDFSEVAPAELRAVGIETIFKQSDLEDFVARESLTNFKLINHYQVKYLTAADGKFDPITVTYPPNKKQVWIGNTKDPSHLYSISGPADWAILVGAGFEGYPRTTGIFPGEPGSNNWVRSDTATETKLCNEGRPDPKAMAAFTNLAGTPAVFHIWSSISFFPDISFYSETTSPSTSVSLTRAPKPTQFYQGRINTQIYPTYWIYVNGELKGKQLQNPDPALLIPNTDKCQ